MIVLLQSHYQKASLPPSVNDIPLRLNRNSSPLIYFNWLHPLSIVIIETAKTKKDYQCLSLERVEDFSLLQDFTSINHWLHLHCFLLHRTLLLCIGNFDLLLKKLHQITIIDLPPLRERLSANRFFVLIEIIELPLLGWHRDDLIKEKS